MGAKKDLSIIMEQKGESGPSTYKFGALEESLGTLGQGPEKPTSYHMRNVSFGHIPMPLSPKSIDSPIVTTEKDEDEMIVQIVAQTGFEPIEELKESMKSSGVDPKLL